MRESPRARTDTVPSTVSEPKFPPPPPSLSARQFGTSEEKTRVAEASVP